MKQVGKFWLPDEDTYFKPFLEESEGFELGHLEMVLNYVTKFNVAVDGGSHVGSWARYMAKRFKNVFAFEPNPETYDCLSKNTEGLLNVVPMQAALGQQDGAMLVTKDSRRAGNTGSYFMQPAALKDTQSLRSTCIPLDRLQLKELDLLKLDVEGYEWYALQGAERTILTCRPTIMIERKNFPGRYYATEKDAHEYLLSLGYVARENFRNDWVYTTCLEY